MRLYELDRSVRELTEMISFSADPETGAIPDHLWQELEELTAAKDERILDIACHIREVNGEADIVEAEMKKLRDRAKALRGRAERLESLLEEAVPIGERRSDARVTISWRKSQRVEVAPTAALGARFSRVKVEPDKVALRDALKAGEVVEGVSLVEDMSIQIR